MKTNNLKSIRDQLGLSQADFAAAIGMVQGNISHYECQRQEVPPDVARRVIAAARERGLVVSFDDIYGADIPQEQLQSTGQVNAAMANTGRPIVGAANRMVRNER